MKYEPVNEFLRCTLYFFTKTQGARTVLTAYFEHEGEDHGPVGRMIFATLQNPESWHDITGPAFRIYKLLVKRRDAKNRAKVLALAMGSHVRLGANTVVCNMDSDLLRLIAAFALA